MPTKKNVKSIPYNSEDAYNLEEVTEEQKKVKAKDVFENYTPPKKPKKSNKQSNSKNKGTSKNK
ncbi:MAG: hypothetical protein ACW98X_26235 [Promethearchaeota archaeon]|jgi:hypothetical protein